MNRFSTWNYNDGARKLAKGKKDHPIIGYIHTSQEKVLKQNFIPTARPDVNTNKFNKYNKRII